jgi:carbamoyltransferase
MKKTGYILGISRGHNAGVCLLKDGKIIFAIEEERLSRAKYDGGPYAAMIKVKEYTDKVDFIVVSHTQSLAETCGRVDFYGDSIYAGLARKLGLIDGKLGTPDEHPQVIDLSAQHHKIHAAAAFYRSGFENAVAVIVDGAGSVMPAVYQKDTIFLWEVESIIDCEYTKPFKTLYKHHASRSAIPVHHKLEEPSDKLFEKGTHESLMTGHAGITKVYEAVTEYCGFSAIEAGKTMGLFPYGKPNDNIPKLFNSDTRIPLSNANVVVPQMPNGAEVNHMAYEELQTPFTIDNATLLQNRRDLAYACQTETQEQVLNLII